MTAWYCERCGPVDDEVAGANYRAQGCPRCGGPLALARPVDDAVAFACPGCHAEVDARAQRCRACGRWFGAPRCRRCRAAVEPGAGRCAACGAALAPTTASASLVLRLSCPVCDADLSLRALGSSARDGTSTDASGARDPAAAHAGDDVLECPVCRGVMVEHALIDEWTADRGARAPDVRADEALAIGEGADEASVGVVRYRRCPRCAGVMNRVNFGPGSGVVVDSCRAHGVWFDPGELGRVLAYARSGRLEVARRRRAAELLDAKRRDAAAADRAVMSVIAGGASWEARARRNSPATLVATLLRWLIR